MKARFASIVVADRRSWPRLSRTRKVRPRAHQGRERSLLTYAIAGFTLQFGALDLATGKFFPIAPVPPDVGTGLVHGRGTSLLYLAFSGKLTALDPVFGYRPRSLEMAPED